RLGKDPTYGPDFVRPPYKLFGYLPEKLDMKEAALRYIQETISKKLAVFPLQFVFRMDDDGKFRKIIEPTSLLSAMWYQFYLALTGEIRLRRCSLCGRWENMEGHRDTWKKHANCANYGRVKRAREKKKRNEQS
ncbi:MAG: hypothetical protein LBR61_08645, partial [Synergistaceae bacterium]|nr:hypothetical protein [Synergistaceae bacterium]